MRELEKGLNDLGLILDSFCIEKLVRYEKLLQEGAKTGGLLGQGEEKQVITRHILDALAAHKMLPQKGVTVADLGSGGGLPGLPLAVALPENTFELIESSQKKAGYLRAFSAMLSLQNVHVIQERGEVLGRRVEYRERYQFLTARGVAALNVLLEYTLPLICTGGWLLAWKGPGLEEELTNSRNALEVLGGYPVNRSEYCLLGVCSNSR